MENGKYKLVEKLTDNQAPKTQPLTLEELEKLKKDILKAFDMIKTEAFPE